MTKLIMNRLSTDIYDYAKCILILEQIMLIKIISIYKFWYTSEQKQKDSFCQTELFFAINTLLFLQY